MEEALPGGVGGVSGDDVNDVFWRKETGARAETEFFADPFF